MIYKADSLTLYRGESHEKNIVGTWLTTSLLYAFTYSDDVYRYSFKKDLNICDLHYNEDFKLMLSSMGDEYEGFLEFAKDHDIIHADIDIYSDFLINVVYNNFDGVIVTEATLEILKKSYLYEYTRYIFINNKVSILIFDKKNLKKREKIKKESLYLTDEYKQLNTAEKEYIKSLFLDMKDNISSLIRKIKIECFTFQNESDILSYLKSLSNKKENETALEKLKRLSNL